MTVHRIVMLDFPELLGDDEESQFRGLLDAAVLEVDGFESYVMGRNQSPGGMKYALVLRFADQAAHDAYVPHPAHAAMGEFLRPRGFTHQLAVVDDALTIG